MQRPLARRGLASLVGCLIVTTPLAGLVERIGDHDAHQIHVHEDHGGHGHVAPEVEQQLKSEITWDAPASVSAAPTVADAGEWHSAQPANPVLNPSGPDPPADSQPRAPPHQG